MYKNKKATHKRFLKGTTNIHARGKTIVNSKYYKQNILLYGSLD